MILSPKPLIGMSAKAGKFGYIPDPPGPEEIECNDKYQEGFCEECDHYTQCLETWREEESE